MVNPTVYPGILVVTSPNVSATDINRLLFFLYDWEHYNENSFWIPRRIADLALYEDGKTTNPPLETPNLEDNEWVGKTIEDVERILAAYPDDDTRWNPCRSFIILDDEGLAKETILWLDSAFDDADDGPLDVYNRCRIPWKRFADVWQQITSVNATFEEYCRPKSSVDSGTEHVRWHWFEDPVEEDTYIEDPTEEVDTAMKIWKERNEGWEQELKDYLTKYHYG